MRRIGASAITVALGFAVSCGADSNAGLAGGGAGNTDGGGKGGKGGTGGGAATGSGGIHIGGSGNLDGGQDAGPECTPGTKSCVGLTPQFCEATGTWIPNTPCPFACKDGLCVGSCLPGTDECTLSRTRTCGPDAEWGAKTNCEFGCDTNGKCKTGCNAGEFNCYGNQVRKCDPGPPSQWVATGTVCDALSGQKCNAATGTCASCQETGGTTPTADYYQYAVFKQTTTPFLGGYDVTSYGDYIYVNRSSTYIDVYKVTLLDSDGDGKLEPNQHPDNPNETGPVEQRQLDFVQSYSKASDGAPTGPASTSSLRALSNTAINSLGPTHDGGIRLYDFATKATSVVFKPTATTIQPSFIGFGADEGVWYGGNETNRRVYSFHEPTKAWAVEFCYPSLAGSHFDGMDAVVSPKTGIQYVYVSDMTSDFIAQYRRDDVQGWVQEALFKYADVTTSPVEGFGFGALKHFWATGNAFVNGVSISFLYELGGGEIQEDLEPCPAGKQACGGTLPACPSDQLCLGGCCSPNPCTNGEQYCGGGQACPAGQICQSACCVSQCPVGKEACGAGLPNCPSGKVCQAGCCEKIG